MNFYIWSHSTDEYDTKNIYVILVKCCIGWIIAYTYGDYGYFNDSIYASK